MSQTEKKILISAYMLKKKKKVDCTGKKDYNSSLAIFRIVQWEEF